jgi:hypothetical protein
MSIIIQDIEPTNRATTMNLGIGQEVIATKMASDSFYKQVRGTVTGIRNGFVEIKATKVISKWDDSWEDHPSSCATSAKIENVASV